MPAAALHLCVAPVHTVHRCCCVVHSCLQYAITHSSNIPTRTHQVKVATSQLDTMAASDPAFDATLRSTVEMMLAHIAGA